MAEASAPPYRKKKQALRNIEAKGVVVKKAFELEKEEERIILHQLGFLPKNVHSIAARAESGAMGDQGVMADDSTLALVQDVAAFRRVFLGVSSGDTLPAGEPTVLRLYPLAVSLKGARAGNSDRQPFPTMYWLSCPSLKAAVSQLENQGLISEWERRLQADQALLADQEAAHRRYAEERWAMLSADDAEVVKRRGWEESFSTGVAGIVNPSNIKCIHTHFAHFLATGQNVVGKWAKEALSDGLHLHADPKS